MIEDMADGRLAASNPLFADRPVDAPLGGLFRPPDRVCFRAARVLFAVCATCAQAPQGMDALGAR